MASRLVGSFPIVSSITTGSYTSRASWHKTEKLPKEYCIMKSPKNNLKHHHHFKSINHEVIGSKCDKCERQYLMNATSAESHESYEVQSHHVSKGILESIKDVMDVFFKFGRLYVTIAMVLGVTSTSLLAVEKLTDLSPIFFIGLFQINKPHLPMASGKYSSRIGVFVVVSSLLMSLGLGWIVRSWPMLWGLLGCFVLTTAYSANTHILKRAAIFPRSIIFALAMSSAFSVVIALAKDIPDIEGDKAGGIQTLAVRIGAMRVFWFCVSLLEMAYGVAILVGATSPLLWSKIVMVLAHSIMALVLWYNAKSVDLKSKVATQAFYMTIFKLYCAEAIVIALAR